MQKLVKKYFKIPYYRHCRINNYIFYLSVGLIPLLPLSTLHHRPQKTHKLSENCEFSVCISALFLYSFKCVLSFIICSWLHILSFHSFSAHSSGFKTVSTLCSQDQVQSYRHQRPTLKSQLILISLPYDFSPRPQLFDDLIFSYILLLKKHHSFFASCILCLPSRSVLLPA